jgi:hypothetical protein
MSSVTHKKFANLILEILDNIYADYVFSELLYKNTLYFDRKANVFKIEIPKKIKVYCKEIEVGDYSAHIGLNNKAALELKEAQY